MPTEQRSTVTVGLEPLTIEQALALAHGTAKVKLSDEPAYQAKVRESRQALDDLLAAGIPVYGVTTGLGDSCVNEVTGDWKQHLPTNLVRFHGCGTGRNFNEVESAVIVAARLASLSRGYSAVRPELLEGLCGLLNQRVLPQIPSEGSVGASGDLTPLSYVAATLIGEREALVDGKSVPSSSALESAGLPKLTLQPKEGLALMNGTSVMTGLACLAFQSAKRLARWSAALTAMMSDVIQGEKSHFDDRIFALKNHPGQRLCAKWIREDIGYCPEKSRRAQRIQDRYSIRCAPHVIGVLLDALPMARTWIETELNSVNDNPIIVPESGDVLHGGNFYGGHICFVMDGLKTAIANLADLLDRQLALICNDTMNNGLPANLVAAGGSESTAHHGFKAMQISASALAAEALKLTMPASVFSRSTENHNQDKVSMGTIAARDCLRVIELVESTAAIHTLALCQAVDLRKKENTHIRSEAMHDFVRRSIPMNTADRRMDIDIRTIVGLAQTDQLPIGDLELP